MKKIHNTNRKYVRGAREPPLNGVRQIGAGVALHVEGKSKYAMRYLYDRERIRHFQEEKLKWEMISKRKKEKEVW